MPPRTLSPRLVFGLHQNRGVLVSTQAAHACPMGPHAAKKRRSVQQRISTKDHDLRLQY